MKFSDRSISSLFRDFPLSNKVKSCIVIPVKDEELNIQDTLDAFLFQEDLMGKKLNLEIFEILILANNCSDSSVAVINDFKNKNPELNIHLKEITLNKNQANIGFVRKTLMDAAFQRLSKNGGGIIMTTDGDTLVEKDWISQNIFEIENGADAVGGRILLKPEELIQLDEAAKILHFKDEKYNLLVAELEAKILNYSHDPEPKHHQHFNGSFAVTTYCYEKSGGIPNVKHLEDCAFFEKMQLIDAKVRHSFRVVVHTSARCIGRTEIGLSYQLNEWKTIGLNGNEIDVESSDSVFEKFAVKKTLMNLWKIREFSDLNIQEELMEIFPDLTFKDHIFHSFFLSSYFGKWYAEILEELKDFHTGKYPLIPIDEAIKDLEKMLLNYSTESFSQTSMR